MRNILTIDLDFISDKYLQGELASVLSKGTKITDKYWEAALDQANVPYSDIKENALNLRYIIRVFLQSCNKTGNVVFGIHHDSILNHIDLESTEQLNIFNIDHHHDIGYVGMHHLEGEVYGECSEASWISVLKADLISRYTWIRNENSQNYMFEPKFPLYQYTHTQAPPLKDIEWDLVYVALSPPYLADKHWLYFFILVDIYEEIFQKVVSIDSTRFTKELRKYE